MRWTLRSDNPLLTFIKNKKGVWKLFLILTLGVALLLFSGDCSKAQVQMQDDLESYAARLEAETASLLSSVEGVGRCRVMLTFATGEETSYHGSSVSSVTPPRVLGATVVCDGGEDDAVRARIAGMLSSMFDIGKNRISVLKLSSAG